jgi:hypothetical protein
VDYGSPTLTARFYKKKTLGGSWTRERISIHSPFDCPDWLPVAPVSPGTTRERALTSFFAPLLNYGLSQRTVCLPKLPLGMSHYNAARAKTVLGPMPAEFVCKTYASLRLPRHQKLQPKLPSRPNPQPKLPLSISLRPKPLSLTSQNCKVARIFSNGSSNGHPKQTSQRLHHFRSQMNNSIVHDTQYRCMPRTGPSNATSYTNAVHFVGAVTEIITDGATSSILAAKAPIYYLWTMIVKLTRSTDFRGSLEQSIFLGELLCRGLPVYCASVHSKLP